VDALRDAVQAELWRQIDNGHLSISARFDPAPNAGRVWAGERAAVRRFAGTSCARCAGRKPRHHEAQDTYRPGRVAGLVDEKSSSMTAWWPLIMPLLRAILSEVKNADEWRAAVIALRTEKPVVVAWAAWLGTPETGPVVVRSLAGSALHQPAARIHRDPPASVPAGASRAVYAHAQRPQPQTTKQA
jgi:hypothetical protein